ncbi:MULTISPECIES: tripartite tricarboxylate transporter TctB family protein [Natrialba]|nr:MULTISPECIES: tripartite tricarboxylate transporter TctB family protein [Natrialba]MWV38501.1 hypothetical protein [Natrialba sp. INN-245]
MNIVTEELRFKVPVFLLLLCYFLVIFYLSLELPSEPRLVPMLIVVPAIVLTVVRIVTLLFPDLFGKYAETFDMSKFAEDVDTGIKESFASPSETAVIVGWFLLYLALIYLFGFIASTIAFSFMFLYVQADQSLLRSGISAVTTGVAIYLVFIVLINVRPLNPVFPIFPA